MMHAEQNYIYILFVILYLVYGFIKANKKAKAKKPVVKDDNPKPVSTFNKPEQQRTPPKQKDFTTVLEEVIGKVIPLPEEGTGKNILEIPAKETEKSKRSFHTTSAKRIREKVDITISKEMTYREGGPERNAVPASPELQNEITLSDQLAEQGVGSAFDIRNAVIASTILQRPEW